MKTNQPTNLTKALKPYFPPETAPVQNCLSCFYSPLSLAIAILPHHRTAEMTGVKRTSDSPFVQTKGQCPPSSASLWHLAVATSSWRTIFSWLLWCLLLALLLLWHSSSVSFADSFSGILKFEAHFLFYIFALTDLILCHSCKWHSYADDFKFITLVLTFLSNTRLINSVADWTSPRTFDRHLKFKRSKKRTFCPS